jgi:hypothetical protein
MAVIGSPLLMTQKAQRSGDRIPEEIWSRRSQRHRTL